jgi:hypothetical protein
MAFEITRQEILKQAIELKKLYDSTRIQSYKDQELRLRRIVVELDTLTLGASDLNSLTDVTISAPANAQVLAYNSTTSQWENQTPSPGGGGDMLKSTYDVDNDGIVDGSETTQIIVRNSTGTTLTKGTVVYLSGATGNRPNAVRAQANTEATSSKTIGIVVANISNNSDGFVAVNGTLHNLDTSAFTAGDAVWLSAATAGAFTSTIPAEPNHTVFIGYIARSHPTQGRIVILIQNGYELNELHGVLISSEANNDLLVYETSTTLWKNKSISTIFGGTPLVSVPTLAQVTTAGNTTTNAITVGRLTTNQSVTASGAIARGVYFNNTLVAAANNDVLVGLDINPTFTNGAFTGVTNVALRTQTGNVLLATTSGNVSIGTTLLPAKLTVSTSSTTTAFSATTVGNSNWNPIATFNNTPASNTPFGLQIQAYSDASNRIIKIVGDNTTNIYLPNDITANNWNLFNCYYNNYWTDATFYLRNTTGGLGAFRFTSIVTGTLMSIVENGNVLIGTTTNAGYKLDVNGTARVQGAFTATLANVSTANVVYYNSSTGLMTYGTAPVGAQFKIDYDPNITGTRNGVNLLFTTSSTFIATTTRVFLNGQRLTRGATYDYVETGTNQITFAAAPLPTDQLIIEYQI